jgi:hypothetical protein
MKPKIVLVILALGILPLLVLALFQCSHQPESPTNSVVQSTSLDSHKSPPAIRATTATKDVVMEAWNQSQNTLLSEEQSKDVIKKKLADIEKNPKDQHDFEIAAIIDELTHPDNEVRQAALDVILQLGDESASPWLRLAAESIEDPQEKAAFLQAADFLELPPAKLSFHKSRPSDQGQAAAKRRNPNSTGRSGAKRMFLQWRK